MTTTDTTLAARRQRAWPAAALLATLCSVLLAGCGGGGGGGGGGAASTTTEPPPPVAITSSLGDFPDPFIVADGSTWLAFATNAGNRNVQVARSSDLLNWRALPDAMPQRPRWAADVPGLVWAPEVLAVGGRWLLYFTARDTASNRQCIGVAEATKPEGPYADTRSAPLVCQVALGGTIDPAPLLVGTELFLYFKNDGNCCSLPTTLWGQRLAPDGLTVSGKPVALLTTALSWEGAVIEAPEMWLREGRLHLFYSGGDYAGGSYAVGHAWCDAPLGPCRRSSTTPILASRNNTQPPLFGPGHAALLQVGNQTWMAYHAWEITAQGTRGNRRFMYVDRVDWVADVPVVRGPTLVP